MTVSIAVTNSASISTWKKVPSTAKIPTTTMTSWTSATSAVTPNFTSRKRYVIQARIPNDPTTISRSAWLIRSLETTGPIVVRELCSAIGPKRACSAAATSPSLPLVGISVLPPPAAPLGDGPADAEAPGLPEGAADGLGDAAADGDAAAELDGAAEADGDAAPDPDGAAEPDGGGVIVGAAVAAGGGAASPIGMVLISRNPLAVRTTVESARPFWARTFLTSAAWTPGSANRMTHRVPPV